MKKTIAAVLCLIMCVGVLAGCGKTETENQTQAGTAPAQENAEKLSIVTTIFPVYDWVRQLLGDNAGFADVDMLLDSGVDLHSYQPTADDIIKISACDMFIYVGGESDEWVEDALSEATNKDMVVINLLESLGDIVREEEVKEGMEGEHEAEHEDEHGEEEEGPEYDEHVWLSLKNAALLCETIAAGLCEIDAENTELYSANKNTYVAELHALDEKYKNAVDTASVKTLVFGDRFPFRYLVDDYGLDYYAAFVGCSAESEASFETIVFLADKVDELGLKTIMQIESADGKIAQTIRDTTKSKDQTILTLDSMQSDTAEDVAGGVTYLSVMTENLEVLKDALR